MASKQRVYHYWAWGQVVDRWTGAGCCSRGVARRHMVHGASRRGVAGAATVTLPRSEVLDERRAGSDRLSYTQCRGLHSTCKHNSTSEHYYTYSNEHKLEVMKSEQLKSLCMTKSNLPVNSRVCKLQDTLVSYDLRNFHQV